MTVRFYLHNRTDAGGWRLIMCQYSHKSSKNSGRKPWIFSTGYKVKAGLWNKTRQRPKSNAAHAETINKNLERIYNKILEIAYTIKVEQDPFPEKVKAMYKGEYNKQLGFWESYDLFLSEFLPQVKTGTAKQHRSARKQLEEFDPFLGWHNLNDSFYHRYRGFLKSRGNSENTTREKIKNLKRFLRYAEKNKWANLEGVYKEWKSRPKETGAKMAYLTEAELKQLESTEYESMRLERVRDLFLFQSGIGLRYSELASLKQQNFVDGILLYTNFKGEKDQRVLLSPISLRIWEKYKGKLPILSNQKYNKYIKEAAEIAGIDSPVKVKGEILPKYKVIATHTARRTFVTFMLNKGIPANLVKQIVGHSDIKTTLKYDSSTEDDKKEAMKKAWG